MMEGFQGVTIDEVRAYWDQRPCNIRHSPSQVGSRQYFDEVEARKYRVEPHIPIFAEFHRWHEKRVLEIGCGIGTDTISFARAGAQVVAVDLSPESLRLARRRAETFGLADRISFYEADAERLSSIVPPQPFDLVYSFGVIHHTPNPERVLAEVRQHFVQSNTTLKIMVYHRHSWKVLWILLREGRGQFWRLEELIARNSEAASGCPITYTYTRRGVRSLVENAGFSVSNVEVEHIFPYRVSDYVAYRYVWDWHFRWMPRSWFRWLERRFGWHLCVTASVLTRPGR